MSSLSHYKSGPELEREAENDIAFASEAYASGDTTLASFHLERARARSALALSLNVGCRLDEIVATLQGHALAEPGIRKRG